MNENYCSYYVAHVKRELCWQLSSALKGTENVAFDRALNKHEGTFEFFVPRTTESIFLELMEYMKKQGVVLKLEKKENRLISENI